jgi:hypothetical protein
MVNANRVDSVVTLSNNPTHGSDERGRGFCTLRIFAGTLVMVWPQSEASVQRRVLVCVNWVQVGVSTLIVEPIRPR